MLLAAGTQARAGDLSSVKHWTYWLSNIDPTELAASPFGMAVVDYSQDGSGERAFTPRQISQMKHRLNDAPRIILGYLSIGEAENYRYYWQPLWRLFRPPWLLAENPQWPGNFTVEFWRPEWQRIVYGSKGAYLDRILASGFDGVMLDVVDVYQRFLARRPQARAEMVQFVIDLSRYAKARVPGFLIVPQNAEELLAEPRYLAAIDGIVKEDLYFGVAGNEVRNPPVDISYSISLLDLARRAGKPVFTVDYVARSQHVAEVYRSSRSRGYVPYAAERNLASMRINPGLD